MAEMMKRREEPRFVHALLHDRGLYRLKLRSGGGVAVAGEPKSTMCLRIALRQHHLQEPDLHTYSSTYYPCRRHNDIDQTLVRAQSVAMDVAYDHIQEEVLSPDELAKREADTKAKQPDLNSELQETYKAITASPWGAKLGGWFSDVKKQGETYYKEGQKEASAAGEEVLKGFTDLRTTLVNRARSMSAGQQSNSDDQKTKALDDLSQPAATEGAKEKEKEITESDALRESEGLVSRFKSEAAKRLKEVQKAEDAADEALLKFGTNVRNFLRDAVTVAPPTEEDEKNRGKDGSSRLLFESKDQDGQRVIHTTRFDAQLHAIHSSHDSFAKDPESAEYDKWLKEFDVEKKTDAIALDLEKYEELRRAMEKLVPEQVEYKTFWSRYYFLRMVIESEEQRRRDMLKGMWMSYLSMCSNTIN